ncbi:MAG: PspA/IM30 family protein [Thalassolituus sp.]
MTEGLLTRIGRLISASANTIVDSLENAAPTMVMEEAIREIDQAIDDVRTQLGKAEAARYLSTKSLNTENSRHAELQAQIEIAVKEKRDDLAEAAISRQMDIEAMIPVIEKSIADSDAEILELNSYIQALQAKKREMQEALNSFIKAAEHHAGSSDNASATSRDVAGDVDKATAAFNRVMNKAGAPGITHSDDGKLAELEQLARNNRIQERLARMKSDAEN